MLLRRAEELTPRQMRSHRIAIGLFVPLLVALAIVVTPLYVLYDVGKVSGPSMLPTLRDGEYMLITRGLTTPVRGDIVILHWKHDGITEELVKRIVALPGDVVDVQGDQVLINGRVEAFDHQIFAGPVRVRFTTTVPAGKVFVCGDNRAVSLDSRFIGPQPIAGIHGRAVAVWWPVARMRVIPSP
jgi:signal peptidase I